MERIALRLASPVMMAIFASVAVADERAAKHDDANPAFDELFVKFSPSYLSSFGQTEQRFRSHETGDASTRSKGAKRERTLLPEAAP